MNVLYTLIGILLMAVVSSGDVQALSEQELTPEEKADFEANWKPLDVTGAAIPWKVFAETGTEEICSKDKDGYDDCLIKPDYSESLKKLDGMTVTLMGFMFPLDQTEEQKNFLIGPYPLSCPYHYHIGPENVIEVLASDGIQFSFEPVTVTGKLSVRFNEETGVFYYLEDAKSQ